MGATENKSLRSAKKLGFVLAVVGALAVGLLISTVILGVKLKDKSDELKELKNETATSGSICNTRECAQAAGDILKAMDLSVNPCDDFYQFSCGNWVKNNPIPDTTSSWNQFNVLREQLNRKIRAIVEMDIKEDEPNPVKLAKQFYKSCLGQNSIDQTELRSLIEDVLKVGDLNPTNIGLKLGELRRRTGGQLFSTLYVELNERRTSNYIIYLDQPSLGLNRAYLTTVPEHVNKKAYRDLIQEVWPLVYPEETIDAEKIVSFETKIAQTSTPPEDRRNRTELYNLMTLTALKDHTLNATMMNWEDYITETFKDVVEKHNVDLGHLPNLTVVVRDMKYFKEFGHVLKESIDADPQTLINYLKWRIILNYGNEVSSKLRDVFFDYAKKTQGTLYPAPRWQVCSDRANAAFGMAISYHYVQDVFSGEFTTQMNEMIGNIQQSFYSIINEIEWIGSDETREKAKAKAEKMKAFIGYPEWLVQNETALDSYYRGLAINIEENYFHNLLQVSSWRNMESLRNIKESKDSNKWITDPTVVNAFYSSTYNSISFPAGILQPPFYFTGKPIQALNYGAVGMVIGHEISHGFDDRGRQSDGDGNLVDWWDQTTVDRFVERAECFVKQYSTYAASEANNLKVNGRNTLGENIADNGGIRQSFKAYQSFVEKRGPELNLPGLEYSPEQLFFVAFAQIWCGSYTPQGMESQIRTGVHSPNRFRVRGVLENSQEFADTWKCPRPDPQKACKIW